MLVKKLIYLFSSLLLTASVIGLQLLLSPVTTLQEEIELGGQSYDIYLPRLEAGGHALVKFTIPDKQVTAACYLTDGTNQVIDTLIMRRLANDLAILIPKQADKHTIRYFLEFFSGDDRVKIRSEKPVKLVFRDSIHYILLTLVIGVLILMLLAAHLAGLTIFFNFKKISYQKAFFYLLPLFFVVVFIIHFLQYNQFYTGHPVILDITLFKVILYSIVWLIALRLLPKAKSQERLILMILGFTDLILIIPSNWLI